MEMAGLHGSFMHILEYGEYFKSIGAEVHVGGGFFADDNIRMLLDAGIKPHSFDLVPLDETYDLVYALHLLPFPAFLAKGLKYRKAILMSLSFLAPIEGLPPSQLWPQFDLLSVLSSEHALAFEKKFSINPKMLSIIPNHIPLAFLENADKKRNWRKEAARVCVVSNHFVPELAQLAETAPFQLDFYGSKYGTTQPVTPELLLNYDAVISIGKTVQYALGLGLPIYEYDKFGGCGFIRPENILHEENSNFSGRGNGIKLDSAGLLADFMAGYPLACANAPALRKQALKRYAIDKIIQSQLLTVEGKNNPRTKLNQDALLFCNAALASLTYMLRAKHEAQTNAG